MGTKQNPGKYDCYTKAKDDEPMFILLARDPLAPILVRLWADLTNGQIEEDKTEEAYICAADMDRWSADQENGDPDAPSPA